MVFWLFIISAILELCGFISALLKAVTGDTTDAGPYILGAIAELIFIILIIHALRVMGTFAFVMTIVLAVFRGAALLFTSSKYLLSHLLDLPLFILLIIAACTCF